MLLSIIIPLYNTEKYIVKCVESALNQDIPAEDYEIIVVNDGSTDNSKSLVEELAARHKNIVLINQPNSGIGTSRNTGLAHARGKYIQFLDSDDYLEPNTFGELLHIIEEEKLDILCLNFDRVTSEGAPLAKDPYLIQSEQNPTGRMQGRDFLLANHYVIMVYCYLLRRDFIDRHSLRMAPYLHEDEEFTPRALFLAKSIRYIPKVAYHYVDRDGSFVHTERFQKRIDLLKAMKSLSDFTADKVAPNDPEAVQYFTDKIHYFTHRVLHQSRMNRKEMLTLLSYCRETGLEPFSAPLSGKKKFLFRHCLPLFLTYCQSRNKF